MREVVKRRETVGCLLICRWVTKLCLFVPNHNMIGLMASKTDRGMRVTEIPRAILLRPQREAFPIKSMDPSTLAPSPQYSIRSGEPITGLITAKMDREIARAYPLRPLGKDFPIKSMAPPSISPYSSRRFLSGDSGVEERADAQEESDALRDLEDQMDTLTMG